MIQVSGKGKGKAAYQVDFVPLSPKDLEAEMKKEIDHVASTLSVNVRIVLPSNMLLHRCCNPKHG